MASSSSEWEITRISINTGIPEGSIFGSTFFGLPDNDLPNDLC